MMLKKYFSLLFLLILTITCKYIFTMDDQKKHIVFDLGLLVQPNPSAAVKKLGVSGISHSIVSRSFSQESALKELFTIVKDVTYDLDESDTETVLWETHTMPSVMVSWLKGKISCKAMLKGTKKVISDSYHFTSRMDTIAAMAFKPKICSQVVSPCIETFKLIEELQYEGHTVHVLGNWHTDVRSNIVSTFADSFSKIKGNILVSGDLGQVKCIDHGKIYTSFLDILSVPYSQVYFIETSEAHASNVSTLRKSESPKVLLEHTKDISLLAAQLRKEGLLLSAK